MPKSKGRRQRQRYIPSSVKQVQAAEPVSSGAKNQSAVTSRKRKLPAFGFAVVLVIASALGIHAALLVDSAQEQVSPIPAFALFPVDASMYSDSFATNLEVRVDQPVQQPLPGHRDVEEMSMHLQIIISTPSEAFSGRASDYEWAMTVPAGTLAYALPTPPTAEDPVFVKKTDALGNQVDTLLLSPIYDEGRWSPVPADQQTIKIFPQLFQVDGANPDPSYDRKVWVISARLRLVVPITQRSAGFSEATQTGQIGWQAPSGIHPFEAVLVPDDKINAFQWQSDRSTVQLDDSLESHVRIVICGTCGESNTEATYGDRHVPNFENTELAHAEASVPFGGSSLLEWNVPWRPWNWIIPACDWIAITAGGFIVSQILARAHKDFRTKTKDSEIA